METRSQTATADADRAEDPRLTSADARHSPVTRCAEGVDWMGLEVSGFTGVGMVHLVAVFFCHEICTYC
jgi:hypothetical protein